MQKVLINFGHGLGDSAMLTAVIAHLAKYKPNWTIDVYAGRGKHSCYFGQVNQVFYEAPDWEPYQLVFNLDWYECWSTWKDSPGTKTCLCLRDKFHIQPDWDLLTYTINIGDEAKLRADNYISTLPPERPFVLLHYEGNTSQKEKNLQHQHIRDICDFLIDHDYTPVILDWDRRSPLVNQTTIFNPDNDNDIWRKAGSGDAETLAALIERAALFVGIDSGPSKVSFTTNTPSIAIWVKHHPIHYCDNAPNALHLIPENHLDYIRGDKNNGAEFFVKHYKYEIYSKNNPSSVMVQQVAKALKLSYNPMDHPELLTSTNFGPDYYEQHRAAGLDYLGHGQWQCDYGRWIVESCKMKGWQMLDVGCACGSIAAGLAKAGALVSGCDLSEHMIKLGRERWLENNLYVCDAVNLHYWKDSTFKMIHSAQAFEHFKPELVPHILQELHRITKPGGLMFSCLDTTELFERQHRDMKNEDVTHVCVKPMAWWDELLKKTGWEHAPEVLESLKEHPLSYFKHYDWSYFLVRCVK